MSSLETQQAFASVVSESVTILIRRNATYVNDPLRLNVENIHGSIFLGAYGDPSLPRPLLIQGRGLNVLTMACVTVSGISSFGVEVDNLYLSGCAQGLVLQASAAAAAKNVRVSNSIFSDIRTPLLRLFTTKPSLGKCNQGCVWQLPKSDYCKQRCIENRRFFSSTAYINTMHLNGNTVQQCNGNCYSFGQGIGLTMENSVLLRDMSTRLFMYGTTDVIIGGLRGDNQLINNDFNQRGEYQGGPDGCAFRL